MVRNAATPATAKLERASEPLSLWASEPLSLKGKPEEVEIAVPTDSNAEVEPQIIWKGQTPFDGFDSKILSRYATESLTKS